MDQITPVSESSRYGMLFEARYYDHASTARLAGISVRRLLKYWRYGLIAPARPADRYGIFFDDEAVFLLRRAEAIRRELDANIRTVVVLDRLHRDVESLRRELRFYR